MQRVQIEVPLSHLVPGKHNPRKVSPAREAHRRLVALIRSQGLLQPLVVRPAENKPKSFIVIAGSRRLAALREIHRGDGDPKIPCILKDVDADTADALSLGENFGKEPMHPLDEAEAFAKLASVEGKGAEAIAAEFGVSEHYVRQRMKMATLADTVKGAYRQGTIDTATAEAFAAVPKDRQVEVWKEVGQNPSNARQVHNVIANAWIDARQALFDPAKLPESAVSGDLFSDRVLVERQAFMEAQVKALEAKRHAMIEEGWAEVVIGNREDMVDRLNAMDTPDREFDGPTSKKLAKIASRRQKLEAAAEKIDEGDHAQLNRIEKRFETLDAQENELVDQAPVHFSEETKAVATAFLILDPDGRVYPMHRIPRKRNQRSEGGNDAAGADRENLKPPTPDDLCDKQLAETFTHQALIVREALLKNTAARKRVLALILHEKVHSEGLSIRREPNRTTTYASNEKQFHSTAFDHLRARRAKIDPFAEKPIADESEAYQRLGELSDAKLDALIDLLVVECITADLRHQTELVGQLADELKVNIRDDWQPDASWLSGFQKIQLTRLITDLQGSVHAPAPERKKSELVERLAQLFADAAGDKLEDKELAQRANQWLPSNLWKKSATKDK